MHCAFLTNLSTTPSVLLALSRDFWEGAIIHSCFVANIRCSQQEMGSKRFMAYRFPLDNQVLALRSASIHCPSLLPMFDMSCSTCHVRMHGVHTFVAGNVLGVCLHHTSKVIRNKFSGTIAYTTATKKETEIFFFPNSSPCTVTVIAGQKTTSGQIHL